MALDRDIIERQRQDLFHLTNMARGDLRGFLWQVKDLPVAEVRDLLIQVMPELVDPYLQAAGELSATWYEDLRREVGARGTFYATTPSRGVQTSRANAVSRWAVDPLVATADAAGDPESVLRRLGGSVHRMIFDAARGAIEGNVVRDPVRVGYQRMPRADCCAFCGMVASRGAVYRSSKSAGGVVGRGSIRTGLDAAGERTGGGIGGGVKARGTMNLGDRYHDDCQCVVMPVFFGTELSEIASIERRKFEEKYQQASGSAEGDGTKALLTAWRKEHGSS